MTTITRRIAAAAALLAAPALIALGTASAHADSAVTNHGPSISHPAQHTAFPNQHVAAPGSPEHHHHQLHRAK